MPGLARSRVKKIAVQGMRRTKAGRLMGTARFFAMWSGAKSMGTGMRAAHCPEKTDLDSVAAGDAKHCWLEGMWDEKSSGRQRFD